MTHSRPRRSPRWRLIAAAALILALGVVLRFAYYDSALETVDEPITREVVRYMRHSGDWDVNWAKANLPADLRYDQYNFSSHHYATFFFHRLTGFLPGTARWRSEREGIVAHRFFVASLACVALLQTLALARRAGGWSVGLGAMLLAGVTPLLVQDAHYVRPEPFTTVLTLAAVALCWPGDSFRPWRAMVAGACVGLLLACKISMLLLVWLPFVPVLAAWREGPRRAWLTAGGAALAIVLGFAVGAPGAWLNPAGFWNGVQFLAQQYARIHPPHSHYSAAPVADMMGRYFAATLGWLMLACFVWGVIALLRKRRWMESALLLGPVVIFAGYFATRSVFFERNLSHIVPLFCIVAALGGARLAEWLAARTRVAFGVTAVICFGLLAARPATISHALVFTELAGRGTVFHEQFEAELRARHREAEWHGELYFVADDGPLKQLAARLRVDPRPVVVRITDYRDERSAKHVETLHALFAAQVVAENPGTFPTLPTCTLLAYHRPTYRYFLVSSVRERARDPGSQP